MSSAGSVASDEQVRARALDPTRSFIVEAPAGSGKTELLIQRYLTLLSRVREPEQVVAISFTRKAAAEMRSRVQHLLRSTSRDEVPPEPHRAATLALARQVMQRDQARGWSLLDQPQRMRIDTVDALNAWLAHRLPVLAGAVAGIRVTDDAVPLYRRAARRCVDRIAEGGGLGPALRAALESADNSLPRLERLLAAVLPMRDQWLGILALDGETALRAEIEAALSALIEETIGRIHSRLGEPRYARLVEVLRHAADHSTAPIPGIEHWCDESPRTGRIEVRLAAWCAAATVLLTSGGRWRVRFSREQGFGPGERNARAAARALCAQLAQIPGLDEALADVIALSDPSLRPLEAGRMTGLQTVLEHLLAELVVVFQETRTVDFTELALAARQALGAVDAPSELLLALDQKLEHLLVDEFQDTSHSQFELLELLTAGWVEGDGRTLFLVGDPMQSIYRFRDADMSLFLRAMSDGIGSVRCEHLVLDDNFRSAPAVVDWVNRAFAGIFPDTGDSGTARYHACRARRLGSEGQLVEMHGVDAPEDELARVIEILERELRRAPDQAIGLLVQSRTHLEGLHARLRARGWPVRAVEIESLARHQSGQDLLGLARALAHPGDRVAWLGVLRAPWCGLTWRDLHALVAERPDATIWESMRDPEAVARLTDDGRQRLSAAREQLERAFELRDALPFSDWVESAWRLLDGPACLEDLEDIERTERFFGVLDRVASDGGIDDAASLEDAFDAPRGSGATPRASGIEIMTIHRAKGLEFDTVIVFGLARQVRSPEPKAMYWHQQRERRGRGRMLMAPYTREGGGLTSVLRRIEARLDQAERARLLYVAVTRARERLHLVAAVDPQGTAPRPGTLLSWLWPRFGQAFLGERAGEGVPALPAKRLEAVSPQLKRLVRSASAAPAIGRSADAEPSRVPPPPFEWASPSAVQVGTLVHSELRRLGREGLSESTRAQVGHASARYWRELVLLGVPAGEVEAAAARVVGILQSVVDDPTGRWILAPHSEARSELRLTVRGRTALEHLRLDRTFVDETGRRWIIDYKTGEHRGGDLAGFLDAEVVRYRAQLEGYARAMRNVDPRPIRLALYFPLFRELRDWPAP